MDGWRPWFNPSVTPGFQKEHLHMLELPGFLYQYTAPVGVKDLLWVKIDFIKPFIYFLALGNILSWKIINSSSLEPNVCVLYILMFNAPGPNLNPIKLLVIATFIHCTLTLFVFLGIITRLIRMTTAFFRVNNLIRRESRESSRPEYFPLKICAYFWNYSHIIFLAHCFHSEFVLFSTFTV